MYRVVIIDDEPIIVEGLSKSVNWESNSCQVVGTAYSGEEGLRVIRQEKPDIIFSDIRMPYMDGLSMIAAIKSEFPMTQIAILTGYRDFDYAQKAIRLGVTRFLLKPSKMDEIEEALRAMTEKLENRLVKEKQEDLYYSVLSKKPDEAEEELKIKNDLPSEKKLYCDKISGDNQEKNESHDAVAGDNEILDSTASSFIVKNAVTYIEEHYTDKLKLSDVADQVYVSQWHLSKLLNRHLGQNFSEILNGIRINKAKELLKDPSLRIGDIADEVGFLDMAHFSRVFKKQVGISANEYRNTL